MTTLHRCNIHEAKRRRLKDKDWSQLSWRTPFLTNSPFYELGLMPLVLLYCFFLVTSHSFSPLQNSYRLCLALVHSLLLTMLCVARRKDELHPPAPVYQNTNERIFQPCKCEPRTILRCRDEYRKFKNSKCRVRMKLYIVRVYPLSVTGLLNQ